MTENPGRSHEGFDLFCVSSTFGNKDKGDKLWDDGFWELLEDGRAGWPPGDA